MTAQMATANPFDMANDPFAQQEAAVMDTLAEGQEEEGLNVPMARLPLTT